METTKNFKRNFKEAIKKLQCNYKTAVTLQWNYSETTVKESETIRKLQETYKKLLKITRN